MFGGSAGFIILRLMVNDDCYPRKNIKVTGFFFIYPSLCDPLLDPSLRIPPPTWHLGVWGKSRNTVSCIWSTPKIRLFLKG